MAMSVRFNSTKDDVFQLDLNFESLAKANKERDLERQKRLEDVNSLFDELIAETDEAGDSGPRSQLEKPADDENEAQTFDKPAKEFDLTSKVYHAKGEANQSVVESENELFRKIFETYSKTQDKEVKVARLQDQVLMNLQQSFSQKPAEENDVAQFVPDTRGNSHGSGELSQSQTEALEQQSRESISTTLEYLNDIETKEELLRFSKQFFGRFDKSLLSLPSFFLHRRKGEPGNEYLERHKALCEETAQVNSENPQQPVLNSFSMPLILNHMLELTCHKFYDGSMALNMFNMTKKDLNLYSVICNQRTYNEIIKTHWVFYGKSSLCEIELILVEMTNNGFEGDMYTYAMLKSVLDLYYKMRIGDSVYNPGGSPIWSLEDEKRVKNIEGKLKQMGVRLGRKRAMRNDF